MQRTIVSLAVLKVSYDEFGQDNLDVYVPFVLQLIKEKRYESLGVDERGDLARSFLERYGLRIPRLSIDAILTRAKKRGYLIKSHEKYLPAYQKLDAADFDSRSHQQRERIEGLIGHFVGFAADRHGARLTPDDAEKALLRLLKDQDIELIISDRRLSVLPEIGRSESCEYLARQFIIYCYTNEYEAYRALVDLAVGHMIASTILYDDFQRFVGKFKGNIIYLDAPLLVHLIGADGPERQAATREFVEVLKAQGAKLRAFESSVHEATRILRRAQRAIDGGEVSPYRRPGPALSFFRRSRATVATIQGYIDKINEDLVAEGVHVEPDPELAAYTKSMISIPSLESNIMRVYKGGVERAAGEPEPETPRMVQRDARVLTYVYLLREGREPVSLAAAKHLLVTENASLVYADRQFARRELHYEFGISASQTDVVVCTIAWLQSPFDVATLNAKRLIADVYASLDPSPELVTKYLQGIDQQLEQGRFTEDQAIVLRGSLAAYDLLQEKTLNDPSRFTARTPEDVLDALLAVERTAADIRIAGEASAHASTREELVKQLEQNEKVASLAAASDAKARDVRRRIEEVGDSIGNGAAAVVLCVACIAYVYGWWLSSQQDLTGLRLWILGAYQIFGLGAGMFGVYVWQVREPIRESVKVYLLGLFSADTI